MSEKTLKFNNISVNKKEFHKSKQPIDLMSVNADQIVVSDKLKYGDEGFKYFIGCQTNKVKLLNRYALSYLIWVDTSNTLKTLTKACLSLIKDDEVWEKYAEIWDVIKNKLGIKFHSTPTIKNTWKLK